MPKTDPNWKGISQDEYARIFVRVALRLSGVHVRPTGMQLIAAARQYEKFMMDEAAARSAGLAIDWLEGESRQVRAVLQSFLFVVYGLVGKPTREQLLAAIYWYRALRPSDEQPLTN